MPFGFLILRSVLSIHCTANGRNSSPATLQSLHPDALHRSPQACSNTQAQNPFTCTALTPAPRPRTHRLWLPQRLRYDRPQAVVQEYAVLHDIADPPQPQRRGGQRGAPRRTILVVVIWGGEVKKATAPEPQHMNQCVLLRRSGSCLVAQRLAVLVVTVWVRRQGAQVRWGHKAP